MLTIYKASAGSGKTYKLAYEYIRMLLGIKREKELVRVVDGKEVKKWYRLNMMKYGPVQPNLHRQVLAITFTNKATEEMKRRIIDNLYELAYIPSDEYRDADYAEALCDEYECTRQELAFVAQWTMRRLLYDYQYFNVSTIDSFFQKVLRSFARELNQQGDFSLELDDNSVMQIAVGNMLDDFNCKRTRSVELSQWLTAYMEEKLNDGRKHNFFNRRSAAHMDLVKQVANIKNEDFKAYWSDMKDYLFGVPNDRLKHFEQALKDQVVKAPELLKKEYDENIDAELGDVYEAFLAHWKETIKSIAQGKSCNLDKLNKVIKEIEGGGECRLISSKPAKEYSHYKTYVLSDDLLTKIKAVVRKAYHYYVILVKIRKECVNLLKLLKFAWPYQEEYAGQNNMVMLSSTNDLLNRIIGDDDAPFIYERVGVMLQNFLIDEFQDTSHLQWLNLKSLVLNGLSQHADSLIIGDEKQSIYRFRNSDSSLLGHKVADDFPGMYSEHGTDASENTNYRSSSDVVTFNNTLFSILPYLGGKVIPGYKNAVQTVKNTTMRGYVLFEPYTLYTDDTDLKKAESERMLEDMCQHILREHNAGCPWRKIAILVNQHKYGGYAIDYMMRVHPEIPIMSGESLYIKKSTAVQLVVGLLRIIDKIQSAEDPTTTDDKTQTAETPTTANDKKYPTYAEVILTLSRYEYFYSKGYDASQALKYAINPTLAVDHAVPDDLKSGIKAIIKRYPSSLLSLVETIIALHLTEDQRNAQLAYLLAFQDLVADYCMRFTPSVHAFLMWWDKNNTMAVQGADDTDAVRLMTVHKSKGLEFRCVHLPYASWSDGTYNPHKGGKWIDTPHFDGIDERLLPPALQVKLSDYAYDDYFRDQAAEEAEAVRSDIMNKIYVAYTRAISELIVYYDPVQTTHINKHIGPMLAEGLQQGVPTGGVGEWQVDLSKYYDAEKKRFEYGKPYDQMTPEERDGVDDGRKPKRPMPGASSVELPLKYDIVMRADSNVLTTLDTALKDSEEVKEEDTKPRYGKDDFPDEAARVFGTQLHDIMSGIVTRDDIDVACARVAKRNDLSASVAQRQHDIISQAVCQDDPLVNRWFGGEGRVLNERSIYNPSIDDNRRLDRLVIYDDNTVDIIDYKFTSNISDKHRNQLSRYISLVRETGMYADVRGYLWYPLKQEIKQI